MPLRFEGKVAVVTGAGSGIGRATAVAFASEGAAVSVVDIEPRGGEETLQKAIAAGGKAVYIQADVANEADARRIADQTVSAFGGIDILHNNAAVVAYAKVTDMSEQDWDRVIAVNLKGPFLCSKSCIPHMVKRGGGAIVNTASVQGFASQRLVAAYAASKGGVIALTRTMALDHAPDNIRVNCICPGSIDTPMVRQAAERFASDDPARAIAGWAAAHPVGRIGSPDEVAKAVLYLASPDASFVTGASLVIDGGLLANLM